jgi:hypothetical protein
VTRKTRARRAEQWPDIDAHRQLQLSQPKIAQWRRGFARVNVAIGLARRRRPRQPTKAKTSTMRTASRYFLRATRHDRQAASQPLNEKRPQLKAGAVTLSSGGWGAEYPEGCLSLPQPCEALKAREGRNLGTDATQSWLLPDDNAAPGLPDADGVTGSQADLRPGWISATGPDRADRRGLTVRKKIYRQSLVTGYWKP